MINKRWVVLAVGSFLLQACGGPEEDAKQAVREKLRDPGSAVFGEFSEANERLACLTVNSKNGVGGYTGEQQALLRKRDGKWTFYTVVDTTHESCLHNWPTIERKMSADDLLEAACAEQKEMGEEYSRPSAGVCLYGHAMSDDQKLEFVDTWNNVKQSLGNLKALEAEGRSKGYIR
jgi:hypothetical protein